jgi:hypothetical protein
MKTPPILVFTMRKFLSCGLIAAFAVVPTALKVCAEPPPVEPVIVSTESIITPDCNKDRCLQPMR